MLHNLFLAEQHVEHVVSLRLAATTSVKDEAPIDEWPRRRYCLASV